MKTYVLVHHKCEQDPRVVQVVHSLKEAGVDTRFVGIGNTQPSEAGFLHLPLVKFWEMPWWMLFIFLVLFPVGLLLLPLFFLKKALVRFKKNPFISRVANGPRRWIFLLSSIVIFLRYFFTFYNFFKDKKDVDIIHCNDLETLAIGVYLKKKLNIPLIYDAHEFFSQQASWMKGMTQRLTQAYEKYLVSHATYLFMVSRPLAEAMEAVYKLDEKFLIVPNVYSAKEAVDDFTATNVYPVKFHYIGGFLEERGIEFLIQSWGQIDEEKGHLHLRGPKNAFYDVCVDLAKQRGLLGKSVFFHPAVSEKDLISTAGLYDVGIIPYVPVNLNNKFCCPNKLSQYMLAGNAVLANDLPNVAHVIETFKNGLSYSSESSKTFVNAVNGFFDLDRLNQMRRNSLHHAQREYSWEEQGRSFLEVYKKIKVSG